MKPAPMGLLLAVSAATCMPAFAAAPLEHREFTCSVAGQRLEFEELRFKPGPGLELRALANPGAHPDSRCRDGYGGSDLLQVLKDPSQTQILGAINGTVFRETRRHGKPAYVSNSLLWSKGQGLIAPYRARGGAQIFVADPHGGHALTISDTPCKAQQACPKLISWLQAKYPRMTLALQSNMPLMDGKRELSGQFKHWSACPNAQASNWRCRPLPRTVLCANADGTISMMTTPIATPLQLADGLSAGGACKTDCAFFYNLDGGRSTQMAYRRDSNARWQTSGNRIETSQAGCAPYRPVDNYLAVVRSR